MPLTPKDRAILEQANARFDKELAAKEDEKQQERDKGLVRGLSAAIIEHLIPMLSAFDTSNKEVLQAVREIKIDTPEVEVPDVVVPEIKIPEIKVPTPQVTVNVPDVIVPEIKIPEIKVPEPKVTVNVPEQKAPIVNVPAPIVNFPDVMSLKPGSKPYPVLMVDQTGAPMSFAQSMGGGKTDFFTIKDIQNSSGGSIIDNDGNIKVAGSFSVTASNSSTQAIDSSGDPYSQANPFPVTVVSGSTATTGSALVDSSGVQYSGSNPLPVTFTGSSSTSVSLVNADGAYYNSDRPLPVTGTIETTNTGVIDSNNSSTTTLAANATFTGTGTEVLGYASLAVLVASDVASATDGVKLEFSSDNVNWDDSSTATYTVGTSPNVGQVYELASRSRYFRVVYTNGGTIQTAFRLQTILDKATTAGDVLDVSLVPSLHAHGMLTKSVLMGKTTAGGGSYVDVKVNPSGALTAAVTAADGDVYVRSNTASTFPVNTLQISGAVDSVYVTGFGSSVSANLIDALGNIYDARDRNWTITETVPISTTQSIEVKQVSGFTDSVNVVSTVGLTDTELRASSVPVEQVSGSAWSTVVNSGTLTGITNTITQQQLSGTTDSVNVVSFNGTAPATGLNETTNGVLRTVQMTDSVSSVNVVSMPSVTVTSITASVAASLVDSGGVGYSGSNPFPVTGPLTDTQLRATSVPIEQVSGSVWSTIINSGTLTGITNTITQQQLSGAVDSVSVTSITGPIGQGDAASALRVVVAGNSDASVTATQAGTWNIGTVTTLTGITNSVAAMLVDSTGVGYSGSNPVPVNGSVTVSGSVTSTVAVGDIVADGADTGSAPVKVGGIARTTNPTSVADGDRVSATYDSVGRAVTTPVQVRGLRSTAYATLNTNTETTLLAGSASTFRDLVWIKFSNTSTGAVAVDLRETTAGNIVDTYQIPANGIVGVSMAVPYPQANIAGTWTVDFNTADVSNTTLYVSALFSNEVA